MQPHNRRPGFRILRERWPADLRNARRRPVLMLPSGSAAAALRLLIGMHRSVLSVVLARGARLSEPCDGDDRCAAVVRDPVVAS